MPCQYEAPDRDAREVDAEIKHYKEEIDRVTAMLCAVMTVLEGTVCEENDSYTQADILIRSIPNLGIWWNHHKEVDRQRKEKVLQGALSKLNGEERELLIKYFKEGNR